MKAQMHFLELYELHDQFSDHESLRHSTRLDTFESEKPFGSFHVGDTVTDAPNNIHLGCIEHIHHYLGPVSDGRFWHKTALYLYRRPDAR